MNERQKYALSKPLDNPFGMPDPKFHRDVPIGKLIVSTIVVVENEGSTYRWHVSAMPRSRTGKAIGLIGNISKDQMNSIMEYCIKLLKGVGDGELSTIPPGDGGFHLFKNLSDGELAMVRKWSVSQN